MAVSDLFSPNPRRHNHLPLFEVLRRGSGSTPPGVTPRVTPGVTPGAYPRVAPGVTPGVIPRVIPGAHPGVIPGVAPGVTPGVIPRSHPGAPPRVTPGATPRVTPRVTPGVRFWSLSDQCISALISVLLHIPGPGTGLDFASVFIGVGRWFDIRVPHRRLSASIGG